MTEDELKRIAAQPLAKPKSTDEIEVPIVKRMHRDVMRFIRSFSISTGTDRIPTLTIYHAYRVWNEGNKHISRHKFTYNLKMLFPVIKKGRYRYVMLSNFPHHLVNISKNKQRQHSELCFNKRRYAKTAKKKKKLLSSTKSPLEPTNS